MRRLSARLLLGTLGPTVVVLAAFAFWAHEESRQALEDALGRRLGAAAAGAALMVLPEQLEAIGAGDEGRLTYARLRAGAERARSTLGVRRVAFVAADLTGRGDTDGRIGLGAVAHELRADAMEIESAKSGMPAASPLFIGVDGQPYKRAYAAIVSLPPEAPGSSAANTAGTITPGNIAPGRTVGYAVVEAAADTLVVLGRLRRNILWAGVAGLGVVVLFSLVTARHVTRPLGRLAASADRIGGGDLAAAVPVETDDEVGQLARRLEQMRGALESRDERLQMMLAGIAHEVRNPLGGLQLYAGLLREGLAGDDERLDEVGRIEREVRHLEQVVNDFLEYARRPHLHLADEAIAPLCAEVIEVAGADARATLELESDLRVRADRTQLRRALLNLVRNALAAAGPEGRIVLAARRQPDRPGFIAFEVRDSGPGVPVDLRTRIWEPFFTTREKGTGLGLAFVREIVRDHGGEIGVDTAPEGGARFHFAVPAA